MKWRFILSILFSLMALSSWGSSFQAGWNASDDPMALPEWTALAKQGDAPSPFISAPFMSIWIGNVKREALWDNQELILAATTVDPINWLTILAAKWGFSSAQAKLGRMYAEGRGVRQDDKIAVKWVTLAAEQGDASAQASLGWRYWQGRGVPQDHKKAITWFTHAAKQGEVSAQVKLGEIYANGGAGGADPSDETAIKWLTLAAEQGHASAQTTLGWIYLEPGDPRKNPRVANNQIAAKWFALAAKQGCAVAQGMLGEIYWQGLPQDSELAIKWLTLAAEQGYAPAQGRLGEIYAQRDNKRGSQGDKQGIDQGVVRGAVQGDGSIQGDGSVQGVVRDDEIAVKWLMLATEQGDIPAQVKLGEMYWQGRGVPQDHKKALELIGHAALERDDAAAQRMLGEIYEERISQADKTEGDRAEGNWLIFAAELGYAPAQYDLAWESFKQHAPLEDNQTAITWFTRAAKQGYADAQRMLGDIHAEGLDDVQAYKWFYLSATGGHEEAAERRDKLEATMTPAQIRQAQQLAQKCLSSHYQDC